MLLTEFKSQMKFNLISYIKQTIKIDYKIVYFGFKIDYKIIYDSNHNIVLFNNKFVYVVYLTFLLVK